VKNNVWTLVKAQLYDQYKLGELRTKGRKRLRIVVMAGVLVFLAVMLAGYSFSLAFGLIKLGVGRVIPSYALAISAVITLFFTIMKSHGLLFAFRDYDMLMSLPVRTRDIIASRFLMMYLMNALGVALILLPMGAAYAIWMPVQAWFYPLWLAGVFLAPLIPTTIAAMLGAGLTAIAVKFKYARGIAIILSFLATVSVLVLSMGMGQMGPQANLSQLSALGERLEETMNRIYPLCTLFTRAVAGYDGWAFVLFALISVLWYLLFLALLSLRYKAINTALLSRRAAGRFQLREVNGRSALMAMYHKEFKRFFSSVVYVLNVGMGVVMLLLFSGASLFLGTEKIGAIAEIPGFAEQLSTLAPFIMAAIVSMSCTSCVSLSLEGKSLWILKSSPVPDKTVFQSKILFNLSLVLPASVLSSLMMSIRLARTPLAVLFFFLVPLTYGVFASVWGMAVNIKLPNYGWENETMVIKQSASAMVGMLGGALIAGLPVLPLITLKQVSPALITAAAVALTLFLTLILYRQVCRSKI